VRLESPGGVVHGYGLAASQLQRLREKQIPLTVAVDKVAASGGYMMACVADKIVAAPFSIIGSIGVVAQIPNFNRFLKNKEIDIELHTAGQYKRTLTLLGKTRKKGVKNSAKISTKRIISLKILCTVCAQRWILSRSQRVSTGTAFRRRRKGWWMKSEPATICCST
jgi:ClpP class serine protease